MAAKEAGKRNDRSKQYHKGGLKEKLLKYSKAKSEKINATRREHYRYRGGKEKQQEQYHKGGQKECQQQRRQKVRGKGTNNNGTLYYLNLYYTMWLWKEV